jgi:TonB family protein
MLFDQKAELEIRSNRSKTLVVSILVHVVLLAIIAFNPEWFDAANRRIIRIAGEDFDLNRIQIQPLVMPPMVRAPAAAPQPAPQADTPPALQTPPQAAPPPPPPPPPPPQPPPPQPVPDRIIRPDDQLIEGARPDGSPRASRGETREQARAGDNQQQALEADRARQAAQEAERARQAEEARRAQQAANARAEQERQPLPNTNPNALRIPPGTLLSNAGRIVEAQLDASRRMSGGRTGIITGDNNGTFSTDPQILSPNPKGIDFGPYLNQLLTRLRTNWFYVMPEIARLGQKGRTDIIFTVGRNGTVSGIQIVANSGYNALDGAAKAAIELSNPFQRLPPEYETDLKLRIAFLYNLYQ